MEKSLKQEKTGLTLLHYTVYTCSEADNLDCFRYIMEIYLFFFLFSSLPGRSNVFPKGNSWCTAMVILALPEQNNQCMILWELMGNRRTEERDGSEIYLEKNTDKENTYSAKKIWLFLRQCEMESEKILNRKSLQHWWRTEPSFCRELWCRKKNLSTVQWSWRTATYHQWPNTYGMKYKLCSVLTAPTLFECWGMTLCMCLTLSISGPIPSSGSEGTIMDCTGTTQSLHYFRELKSSWELDEPPFAFYNCLCHSSFS